MSDQLQIGSFSFSTGELKPGAVLTPVDMYDGKPFFLETGPDGEAVLMMNVTKEYFDEFEKVWFSKPDPE